MKIGDTWHRSVRFDAAEACIHILDQTVLPHRLQWISLSTPEDVAEAIVTMRVRGAPLIGAVAAYGFALAIRHDPSTAAIETAFSQLLETRPTAVNLRWALERLHDAISAMPETERYGAALKEADAIADEDVRTCELIGEYGLQLLRQHWEQRKTGQARLNILTHCNAGWFATVDWGTALAPIYKAHDAGIPVHVWVDETRPRNQGAITAMELALHGVPHTVITDNAGGLLMQRGEVDICIVGTDRTTAHGDVCNKIGTYLKALAAHDNGIPFFVGLPTSTIDWRIERGSDIPIEDRAATEITHINGIAQGQPHSVAIYPADTAVANPAFDVTPNYLVTGLITEWGVYAASEDGLKKLQQDMLP
ncbi:MAG TPA: S-methyl-5-thioribose-1-phosphate isomerase [Pseudomonadales bacterium]